MIAAGYLRGLASATSRRDLKPHPGALFADPDKFTRHLTDHLPR